MDHREAAPLISAEKGSVAGTLRSQPLKFDRQLIQGLAEIILNSALQLPVVPFGGSVSAIVFGGITLARDRHVKVYMEELNQRLEDLSEETLKSEDFSHLFMSCTRAALETKQDEKIKLFARLFANYVNGNMAKADDGFEDFLSLLKDLSYREFCVLTILYRTMQPGEKLEIGCSPWHSFEKRVEVELRITKEELPGVLERLKRSGLYIGYGEDPYSDFRANDSLGALTPNFHAFCAALGK